MLKGLAKMTMAAGAISLFMGGCVVDKTDSDVIIALCVVSGLMLLTAGSLLDQYIKATERVRRIRRKRRRIEMKKSA